jgi:glutathione S-transferase
MLTLYQAEWCPYSSAVRERLTELGLPFVAQPVEPEPEAREELRRVAGTVEIPVLVTDEGEVLAGSDAVLGWLAARHGPAESRHRQRFAEHAYQRDGTAARLLERAAPLER